MYYTVLIFKGISFFSAPPMSLYAFIPAAGSGTRLGAPAPKQYLALRDRPMLWHSVCALMHPRVETVFVVLSPSDKQFAAIDWRAFAGRVEPLYCGGATRRDSVYNGLVAATDVVEPDDWVLVHDAARPCLAAAMIDARVAELADDPVGGIVAVPVADTLKRADVQQRAAATVPRDGLWQAQTPQMFRYGTLCRALAANPDVTDEAGAIEALGLKPRLVKGDASNLKVTYPADLSLAEAILRSRLGPRAALGALA